MKNILIYSIALILVLSGCSEKKSGIKITESKNGFVTFSLSNDQLTTPLKIAKDTIKNQGSIFWETSEGKFWLKGKPTNIEESGNTFKAEWKINERIVKVSFTKTGNKYDFDFTAKPSSDIIKWGINLAATKNEYFTGLFERVVDGYQENSWKEGIQQAMDLRGQKVKMFIQPALSLYCPFYLSSNKYGLFIKGTWPGHYDFCNENPDLVQIQFEGQSLNGIIYTSKNPAETVKAHSLHVGPTIIPPKWTFLPWRWRDNHANNEKYYDGTPVNAPYNSMLVEDILMMEALDIPCGVYFIDRPWAKTKYMKNFWLQGYADFEWDEERIPNPQAMIKWLEKKDIRLLLWIAPWITGDWVKEAKQKKYNIAQKGSDTTNLTLIDFTNPEAVKWWQEKGLAKVLKDGVKGFKLDRAEEIVLDSGEVKYHNGKTAREMRNAYPVYYTKAANEICKKIHGDDFVMVPRAGYSGSAKYTAFWGGDTGSPAEGLRCAIIQMQRCAIIGFPVWGSDIGGYWHGGINREVTARWLAFGAFNPIMEFGPTEDRAPWDMEAEPHYDTELLAIWRLYAKLHASLSDYSYDLAVEANKTGMPIVRPLFLEYPEQQEAWKDWQTFLYGHDLLVSVVWQKGKTKHTCYLPKGNKWQDAWNPSKIYEGGQTIEINTPLHKIPIFVREGSKLNLGDLNELYKESYELAKNKPDLQALQQKIK